MSLTSVIKGWAGEAMGAVAHWAFLDKSIYFPLDNLTLPTKNGTTQIDHVIVSKFGIFVIEAKNIDGWIFGDERSSEWSVVKPGRKFRFQNPLRQNYRHVKAISAFLEIEEDRLHSLVMFWGECEFKTPMPANVMLRGYASYIKGFDKPLFSDDEVVALVAALRSGSLPKTWSTRRAHIESLHARHSSTTTCPKCASALVLRTAKKGAAAGSRFYGCSAYPKCRHTAPYAGEN
ncbi:MAG TPA: NERD domain-containing protein [Burkholderiaceae bacterium]|nr:NERD domain-containing protein [Burkholderiaceae bacterium]